MNNCARCGKFHHVQPGCAWKLVYGGGPVPTPERELTMCKSCTEKYGGFYPQSGIRPEFSCGIVERTTEDEG